MPYNRSEITAVDARDLRRLKLNSVPSIRRSTMRIAMALVVVMMFYVVGCTVYEAHPRPVVREETVVRDDPVVVYRDTEPEPPRRVEVIPARPYRSARWQPGHWQRDR